MRRSGGLRIFDLVCLGRYFHSDLSDAVRIIAKFLPTTLQQSVGQMWTSDVFGMQLRAFAKKPIFVAGTSALVAGLIRLVRRTSSTTYEPPNFHAEVGAHQPFILAMWHGR